MSDWWLRIGPWRECLPSCQGPVGNCALWTCNFFLLLCLARQVLTFSLCLGRILLLTLVCQKLTQCCSVLSEGVAKAKAWCPVYKLEALQMCWYAVVLSLLALKLVLEDKLARIQETFDMLKSWKQLKGFGFAWGYTKVSLLFWCLCKCSNRFASSFLTNWN